MYATLRRLRSEAQQFTRGKAPTGIRYPAARIGTINATSATSAGAAGVRPAWVSPANPGAGPATGRLVGAKASAGPAIAR